MFQVFWKVENSGSIYPMVVDAGIVPPDNYVSPNGKGLFRVRYNPLDPNNLIYTDVTGFVTKYPYPHDLSGDPDTYNAALYYYQVRVALELQSQIRLALQYFHGGIKLPGDALTMSIAYNGGKLPGYLAEQEGIDISQMTTAQVKRIPLQGGGMVIGIGGIQFAYSIHRGLSVCHIVIDDCTATWQTAIAMDNLLQYAGVQIVSRFVGSTVGTVHPILADIHAPQIPTVVSVSLPCLKLGPNAYLFLPPELFSLLGDGMVVGDMGKILNLLVGDKPPLHAGWGMDRLAYTLYV